MGIVDLTLDNIDTALHDACGKTIGHITSITQDSCTKDVYIEGIIAKKRLVTKEKSYNYLFIDLYEDTISYRLSNITEGTVEYMMQYMTDSCIIYNLDTNNIKLGYDEQKIRETLCQIAIDVIGKK